MDVPHSNSPKKLTSERFGVVFIVNICYRVARSERCCTAVTPIIMRPFMAFVFFYQPCNFLSVVAMIFHLRRTIPHNKYYLASALHFWRGAGTGRNSTQLRPGCYYILF